MKNNAELNKAIYTVLTTQFKKDAPAAFDLLKENGFVIDKWDGAFSVSKNGKSAHVEWRNNNRITYRIHMSSLNKTVMKWHNHCDENKIDFVSFFEKPRTYALTHCDEFKEYYNRDSYRWDYTPSQARLTYNGKIKSLKSSIKYYKHEAHSYQEKIVQCQKRIAEYMKEIERMHNNEQQYRTRLNQNRAELGLINYIN